MKFEKTLPNFLTVIVLMIYAIGVVWWSGLRYFEINGGVANYFFSIPMGMPPLIVGAVLLISSLKKSWNFSFKRYALYLGAYLFLWGFATIGTIYYNIILKVEAPFPSILDVLYISSQICLLIAVIGYMAEIRKWHYVKEIGQKILFFGTAPVIQLILYWVVMQILDKQAFPEVNWQYLSGMFSLILNILVFVVLYIFAFILFFYQHNKQESLLGFLVIIGVTFQYITDYYFILLLARDIFYIGHFVDFMFMTVYFYMSLVGVRIVTDEYNVL